MSKVDEGGRGGVRLSPLPSSVRVIFLFEASTVG